MLSHNLKPRTYGVNLGESLTYLLPTTRVKAESNRQRSTVRAVLSQICLRSCPSMTIQAKSLNHLLTFLGLSIKRSKDNSRWGGLVSKNLFLPQNRPRKSSMGLSGRLRKNLCIVNNLMLQMYCRLFLETLESPIHIFRVVIIKFLSRRSKKIKIIKDSDSLW